MRIYLYIRFMLLFLFCGATFSLYAQFGPNFKRNFKWEEKTPKAISVADEFASADAVILSEEQRIKSLWLKSQFLHVYFSNKLRIKFQTEEGIKAHSKFAIPHSNDPTYDRKDLPFMQKDSLIGPPFRDVRVIHFAARIIKPDGSIKPVKVLPRKHIDQVECFSQSSNVLSGFGGGGVSDARYYNELRTIFTYTYDIQNLEPGDELEIDYQYEVPYAENWYWFNATRVFFNGELPKQKFHLKLTQNKKLQTVLKGVKSDSISETKKSKTYHWNRKNLAGCMSEPGSKPYLDLEHIIVNLNSNDFRYYSIHSLSGQAIDIPYWVYVLRMRESRSLWLQRIARKKLVIDQENKLFDDFLERNTVGISDSFPVLKAIQLHNTVAEEFEFRSRNSVFEKRNNQLEKLGSFVSKKQFREQSTYNLYAKMLYRLRVPFFTTYFTDNRIAAMNHSYTSPMWDTDFSFTIPNGRNMYYLYPKKSRMGYYANELPFYLEGTTAFFTSAFRLFSNMVPHPEFIQTPGSDEKSNYRTTNVLSEISLKKKHVKFDAKINLSGQFSTMTRGSYLYDYTDPKANPLYGRKVFDLGKTVKIEAVKYKDQSVDYPYKANLRCMYNSNDLVRINTDGIYEIDLKGWFNVVFEERFKKANRHQPFYPDFLFRDQFKYYLEFDQNIELVNLEEFCMEIDNSYGKYEFNIQKVQDNVLLLELVFHVTSNKIEAVNANNVEQIIHQLRKITRAKLKVKTI